MSHPQRVAIIGAGIMGSGIAQSCAVAGLDVTMLDVNNAALALGYQSIQDSLGRLVGKNKLAAEEGCAALAKVITSTDYGCLQSAQLVIEAATENLEIKRGILQRAESMLSTEAVLATNTSSLSLTVLAAALSQPQRFIGMHFFNPAPLMPLVELIRAAQTADATLDAAQTLVRQLGKTPVIARNSPGFVVNRILCPMINEAIFVLQENVASAADIDAGMKLGCNQPIGPLALADLIGLDTLLAIMEVFYRDFADPKYRPAPLLREMVAAGSLGRKSGQGFFKY